MAAGVRVTAFDRPCQRRHRGHVRTVPPGGSLSSYRLAPDSGDRPSAGGRAEPRQAEAVLDRPQHAVVRDDLTAARARPDERPEHERRDAAAADVALALVEGDEDGRVLQRRAREQRPARKPFSQRSPVATEQSCIEWQRSGTTSENAGSFPARRSDAKRVSGTTCERRAALERIERKYRNGECFIA